MMNSAIDSLKKLRILLSETFSSFRRNKGLTAASSLAFLSTLALVPTLLLFTFLLGALIGSSARALEETQELLKQLVPAYSQMILNELSMIMRHKRAISVINIFVLLWAVTRLVAGMRISLSTIFQKTAGRPFLLEKLFDVAISILFLAGFSVVAIAGVALPLLKRIQPLRLLPGALEEIAPFIVFTGVVFALYFTFSTRVRFRHLAIGSLVTSLLWFALRPVFYFFLTYNPGYGFAFGSFKSLFVVLMWIYLSQALFLFGAEIVASFGRGRPSSSGA
jgi:membrane protein